MSSIIVANFGNESVALIQWCIEKNIKDIQVVSVDTGWQAEKWNDRVEKAHEWLAVTGVLYQRLKATYSMQDCVRERGSFPNKKFQWCAGFLKGLALNDYFDDIDPSCEKTLMFAKRQQNSRANRWLDAKTTSEHFGGREVLHPLLKTSNDEAQQLVHRAGFKWLSHPSLECAPCIHPTTLMVSGLSQQDILRVEHLEQEISQPMFDKPIKQFVCDNQSVNENESTYLEQLDMGCGSEFGCGE